MFKPILFYIISFLTVVSAVSVIIARKAIYSAVSLVAVMLFIAILFIMQSAYLVAMIQVLVYAGAVMVLFVFVIMLLNADEKQGLFSGSLTLLQITIAAFILFFISMAIGVYEYAGGVPENFGRSEEVGKVLYYSNLLPFEIASVLLLVALVGAVILTKRKDQQ